MAVKACTLELRNYRPFVDEHPIRIQLGSKFHSFVGPNNSGKSTILRFFWEFRSVFSELSEPRNIVSAVLSGLGNRPIANDPLEVFCDLNDRSMIVRLSLADRTDCSRFDTIQLTFGRDLTATVSLYTAGKEHVIPIPRMQSPGGEWQFDGKDDLYSDLAPYAAIFLSLTNSMYCGPFRNAIAVNPAQPYYDLNVGIQFIQTFDALKQGANINGRTVIRKLIDQIKDAFEFKHLNIDASSDNQTLTIDINHGTYTLPQLGAGIAQYVILLTQVAMKRPTFLLIDEPELNLHPALQMKLLPLLGLYADHILFATHSIGLSYALSEMAHIVSQSGLGYSTLTTREDPTVMSELLGSMSYSAYQEIGANAILMVEGPTDVPVIQHFLSMLGKRHLVVVAPLNGSSGILPSAVEQLQDLKRLTPKVYAIIDSEKEHESQPLGDQRAAFVSACEKVQIKVKVLNRRATENYFPTHAVQEVLGTGFKGLEPYERLKDCAKPWSKGDNYRIAQRVSKQQLESTDLGAFLLTLDANPDRIPIE
jgi:ABC-type ATPase involved in cell division